MKEKTLLLIATICSVIGILALFIISENIELTEIDISEIEGEKTGRSVKIIGRIEKVSSTEKIIFLEIGQEKIETIPVILFKDSDLELIKGQNVEITGEIMDYEGKKEVIANKIRII